MEKKIKKTIKDLKLGDEVYYVDYENNIKTEKIKLLILRNNKYLVSIDPEVSTAHLEDLDYNFILLKKQYYLNIEDLYLSMKDSLDIKISSNQKELVKLMNLRYSIETCLNNL